MYSDEFGYIFDLRAKARRYSLRGNQRLYSEIELIKRNQGTVLSENNRFSSDTSKNNRQTGFRDLYVKQKCGVLWEGTKEK